MGRGGQLLVATITLLATTSLWLPVQADLCDEEGVGVCMSYFDGSVAEVHRASESEWYLVSSNSRAKVNQLYKSVDQGCTWSNVMAALDEGFEPDTFSGYAGVRGVVLAAPGSTSRAAYFIGFGNRYWTTEGGTWGSFLLHHIDESSITAGPLLPVARGGDDGTVEVLSIVNIEAHETTGPYALLTALVGPPCDNDCDNRTRYQALLATTDQGSNWGFIASYVTQSTWLGRFYSVGWVSQAEEHGTSGESQLFDYHQSSAAAIQRFFVTRDLGATISFTSPPGVVEMSLQRSDVLFIVTISSLEMNSRYASRDFDQADGDALEFSLWVGNGYSWRLCEIPATSGANASALHVIPYLGMDAAFLNIQYGNGHYGSVMAALMEPFDSVASFSFWETLPGNTVSPSVLESLPANSSATQLLHSRQADADGSVRVGLQQVVNFLALPVGDSLQGMLLANIASDTFPGQTSLESVTVYSTTLGATWEYSQLLPCSEEPCFVHILGPGDTNVYIGQERQFSNPLAVGGTGVVFAIGMGDQLSTPTDERVMLSRDAGKTWSIVTDEAGLYSASSGGDVFLSSSRAASEGGEIGFSLDQSTSFTNCELLRQTEEELVMESMSFIDSSTGGLRFVLSGAYEGDADTGFMAVLSFDAVVSSTDCTGADEPDAYESDYESWTPSECFTGTSEVYTRRKPLAHCFTAMHPWGSMAGEQCVCSRQDYWCDGSSFMTEGDLSDSECVSVQPMGNFTCFGHEGEALTVSQGYTLVPGDSCSGGVDLSPVVIECPGDLSDSLYESSYQTTYTAVDYVSLYWSGHNDDEPIDDADDAPIDWTLVVYLSIFGVVVVVLLVATVAVFGLFAYHRVKDMRSDNTSEEDSYFYDELDELDGESD